MRFSLLPFILLLGCEEKSTKEGNNKTLIFATNQLSHDKRVWRLEDDAPVAAGSHFQVSVDTWSIFQNSYESPEERTKAFASFVELYNEADIDVVKKRLKKEEFTFTSDLTILSTATNQSSNDHMGSVLLTAKNPGKYRLTATGIVSDNITIEVATPTAWKVSPSLPEVKSYTEEDNTLFTPMSNFCLVPNQPFDFEPVLFDEQGRKLYGLIPNLDFTTSTEHLLINPSDKSYLMTIDGLEPSVQATLEARDVFNQHLFTLPPLDICVASEDDVKGVGLTILHDNVEESSKAGVETDEKIIKINKHLRKYARKTKRSELERMVHILPIIDSDKNIPNFPIEVTIKGGLLMELNALSKFENDATALLNIGPTVLTSSNSPIVALLPNNKDEVITLKAGNVEHSLTIVQYVPKEEEEDTNQN